MQAVQKQPLRITQLKPLFGSARRKPRWKRSNISNSWQERVGGTLYMTLKKKIELNDLVKTSLKIKEPLDVQKTQINVTDHGMIKVMFSVIPCAC